MSGRRSGSLSAPERIGTPFVAFCVTRHLAGVECLSGIPGSVGATPVQNVGAYGQEVSQTIASVLVFDLNRKEVREMDAADCEFGYRSSIFNTRERGRYIILRVTYEVRAGGAPSLRYADLQKYFADRNEAPTLAEVRKAVLEIRASKGMLITPGDPDSRSAGSFFKNPVLTTAQFDDLLAKSAGTKLAGAKLSGFVTTEKDFSRLAGGEFRIRKRLRKRPSRNFQQARAGAGESRRRNRRGNHCTAEMRFSSE